MQKSSLKILVTGGSSGLGRIISNHLVRQGHNVYVLSKSPRSMIDPEYLSLLSEYVECDLSDIIKMESEVKDLAARTCGFDVLVNNASSKQFKLLDEFHTGEISANITVDFIAPAILCNICLPYMKEKSFGRIINISSISAFKGYKTGTLYCAGKSALITFSETLNCELSGLNGNVTVNAICPDSFSRLDGTELENHKMIMDSINENIDKIIRSDFSGKIITVFTLRHKFREKLRFLKRALFMS